MAQPRIERGFSQIKGSNITYRRFAPALLGLERFISHPNMSCVLPKTEFTTNAHQHYWDLYVPPHTQIGSCLHFVPARPDCVGINQTLKRGHRLGYIEFELEASTLSVADEQK
jgi:hypothetical protein